jgi:hypothetical protein
LDGTGKGHCLLRCQTGVGWVGKVEDCIRGIDDGWKAWGFISFCIFVSYVSSLLGLMANDLYLLGKLAWSHRPLRANGEYQISTAYGSTRDISPDFVKLATLDTVLLLLAWPVIVIVGE